MCIIVVYVFFPVCHTEKGYDDCLLGSQIDGYYRYEPSGVSKRELDKAATKIQSTFRGHKVRQEAKALTETGNEGHRQEEETSAAAAENFGGEVSGGKEHEAASRIQAGYRGYNARQTLKARNQAATKIQAGYRGYTVRKDLEGGGISRPNRKDSPVPWRGEEEAAALKIQSAFRGHRAREAIRSERNMNIGENEGKIMAAENSEENERNQMEKSVNAVKDAKMARDDAATTIQSSYRGYYTRQQLKNKNTAATTIQAHYKGYRARKIRRTRSEAAVTIQSYYRGHRTRESLKKRSSTKTYLEVSVSNEFALHRDSRTSFSLPAGVKFEGNLDEDSDEEIDKMVDKLKAIQESSSPDLADDKADS